jgi:DNA-directed RNA polymerase subunit RPC12/RpoP
MNPPTTPPEFQPPAGFIPVESALEGITVFAPAPAVDLTPEIQEFKCPQCGGITAFDPGVAGVTCQHCGTTQATEAEKVGRTADEHEFTLENLALAQRGWGAERKELHCESCGADLSITADDLSNSCPFCASNRVIARVATQETLRPRFLIPFKFEAQACQPRVKEWLGKGWMHPSDLSRAAGSAEFRGVYLPFWTFDATVQAEWRAEVGYERTERYYDSSSKSWKTRTRIDWRWESGHVRQVLDDWLGIGTTKISRILLRRLYPFALSALVAYEPGFLAGWQALNYDISLQPAWDTVKAEMREGSRTACRNKINSPHVRNFSMLADFEDETWRYILLPVYAAAYRFEGETYQVLVNGQNGIVAGQKPIAWWKVWLAIAGLLTPGVLFALLGLVLLLFGGIGIFPLGLGGILFVIGLVISVNIFRQATAAGEA